MNYSNSNCLYCSELARGMHTTLEVCKFCMTYYPVTGCLEAFAFAVKSSLISDVLINSIVSVYFLDLNLKEVCDSVPI